MYTSRPSDSDGTRTLMLVTPHIVRFVTMLNGMLRSQTSHNADRGTQ